MAESFGLNGLKGRNGIDKKALGRGIGSGCGKTSSYGHKGGKARSGRGAVKWFEGGQMPVYRRLPKRGFVSARDRSSVAYINLVDLQRLCDGGRISSETDVTLEGLKAVGAVNRSSTSLRLLAKGSLSVPLNISVSYASGAALAALEKVGGKVQIV
ncbi:MAG: 50S ribosomal protein L15 [Holosporaceae bacterium]|jgi:large subunit ribosomal protein L15|nr:50S ribosomal protein L15 [Holosporaceae bacterium]